MKVTQTNMEETERDTERSLSVQETDSDQPRQNKELVRKREGTSVTWRQFGYEQSDKDQKTVHFRRIFILFAFVLEICFQLPFYNLYICIIYFVTCLDVA